MTIHCSSACQNRGFICITQRANKVRESCPVTLNKCRGEPPPHPEDQAFLPRESTFRRPPLAEFDGNAPSFARDTESCCVVTIYIQIKIKKLLRAGHRPAAEGGRVALGVAWGMFRAGLALKQRKHCRHHHYHRVWVCHDKDTRTP